MHLFFDTADWRYTTSKGDFTSHSNVGGDSSAGQEGHQCADLSGVKMDHLVRVFREFERCDGEVS